jgi:hypothetical protein
MMDVFSPKFMVLRHAGAEIGSQRVVLSDWRSTTAGLRPAPHLLGCARLALAKYEKRSQPGVPVLPCHGYPKKKREAEPPPHFLPKGSRLAESVWAE